MKKIVAIQGVKGAFHQEAAISYFGPNIEILECLTFSRLIESVERKEADYGIMAIENTLTGSILPNYALIRDSSLSITGEIYLKIVQNLIAPVGETIATLSEVRSHPVAIAQCSDFFKKHPSLKIVESEDTALSAKQIAELKLKGIATIASKNAAKEYGLQVIEPSIETNKVNYTRFLILEHKSKAEIINEPNKASITFTALHRPGSLLKILQPFADYGINMTMLQSLPIIGCKWEYIFHADLVFMSLIEFNQALDRAKQHTKSLDILGIYSSHELHEQEEVDCLVHFC